MYTPDRKQVISEADAKEVLAVLKLDWLTQGPVVKKFELAIENVVNCKHATAVNIAIRALHLSVRMQSLRLSHGLGPCIEQLLKIFKYSHLGLECLDCGASQVYLTNDVKYRGLVLPRMGLA